MWSLGLRLSPQGSEKPEASVTRQRTPRHTRLLLVQFIVSPEMFFFFFQNQIKVTFTFFLFLFLFFSPMSLFCHCHLTLSVFFVTFVFHFGRWKSGKLKVKTRSRERNKMWDSYTRLSGGGFQGVFQIYFPKS